jgi:hypothetical protein
MVRGFTVPTAVRAPTLATKLLTAAAVVRSGAQAACCREIIHGWKVESIGVDGSHSSVRSETRSPLPGVIIASE